MRMSMHSNHSLSRMCSYFVQNCGFCTVWQDLTKLQFVNAHSFIRKDTSLVAVAATARVQPNSSLNGFQNLGSPPTAPFLSTSAKSLAFPASTASQTIESQVSEFSRRTKLLLVWRYVLQPAILVSLLHFCSSLQQLLHGPMLLHCNICFQNCLRHASNNRVLDHLFQATLVTLSTVSLCSCNGNNSCKD